jgi:predicted RNA-binding Zn-ribbon protein involved in translation (DUF1610 family)
VLEQFRTRRPLLRNPARGTAERKSLRRSLAFISLALFLIGLELSTEAISLTFSRLAAGAEAILAGVQFEVPALRYEVGVCATLSGIALGVVLVWSARAGVDVRAVGHTCPNCGSETRRVKRKQRHKLLSVILGEQLSRRKCETCGWVGLSLRH